MEVAHRSGWAVAGIAIAALLAAPLAVLPLSFVGQADALDSIAASLLPDALRASVVLAAGVGVGTLLLGGSLAALVSFFDFPGRRWLDWALVLPLAMPAYVLVFVLLGRYDSFGRHVPNVRSTLGTIVVLTVVLYPYVYVLARSAFLGQSRQALEAARTLGLSHAAAVRRVALPLARPALAGGVALAVMEALADFGAVNLLNYRALTDAIYRVWYGTFDQAAALQLATVLVSLALTLVALERLLRGRARYHQALARGDAARPQRLRGAAAWVAAGLPALLLVLVFVGPTVQLVMWAVGSLGEGAALETLARAAVNSLLLASIAALVAVAAATAVAYGPRAQPSRVGTAAARLSALGYAVPGSVVAVAVYVPLAWVDHRLDDAAGVGLLITGSAAGLILAYVVRFHALALFSVQARMGRIDPALDEAARSLGADRSRLLTEVHLPLLWPGIATAALLVFVEVMKELPATALLRPLGGDTLAIAVWEATKDSRFDTAALPALLIVLVGLIPVVLAIRLSRAPLADRGGPAGRTGVEDRPNSP
ncbi:MAG TPA: iron ABC transporter permease [Solirubrobacteraceae bacterium]